MWRRRADSNRCIEVLQTSALATWLRRRETRTEVEEWVERETGFEPATPTLARSCSTTELFPHHRFLRQRHIVSRDREPSTSGPGLSESARGLAQRGGGVLGRHGVDEEAAPPLEAGDPRELGDDLEVPVEVLERRLVHGRAVEHEVVGWIVQRPVHAAQEVAEDAGQRPQLIHAGLLERGAVTRGQDPRLERKARREGGDGHEAVALDDEPAAASTLLPHDVAPHAALLDLPVLGGAGQLLGDHDRNDGQRDELRVRMLERSAGGLAVILEDEDGLEAAILLEIEHALSERQQHLGDGLGRQGRQRGGVLWALDHDFVSA